MRTGKVSENVLKRSILKRCRSKNEKVAQGPAVGQDCAIVRLEEQKEGALHVQVIPALPEGSIRAGMICSANNLYCSRAVPCMAVLAVLLPPESEEGMLRQIMDEADSACRELGIALGGGHTEVTDQVKSPMVTVTLFGMSQEVCSKTAQIRPDLDLVMAGYPALAGTAFLARKKEKELKERFPLAMIDEACSFDSSLSVKDAAGIGWECGAVSMHDISQGGVFGALWEFGESRQVGMDADLRKIPIRQETIEICEIYGWNPYQLLSGGSVLMAVPDGQMTVEKLRQQGIRGEVIGRTIPAKEKILRNGEESRYLDKPARDEICRLEEIE